MHTRPNPPSRRLTTIVAGPEGHATHERATQQIEEILQEIASNLPPGSEDGKPIDNPIDDGNHLVHETRPPEEIIRTRLRKMFRSSEAGEFIMIPMSWYRHIRREYRGQSRAYHDAIHLLAYIISHYRRKRMHPGRLLHLHAEEVNNLFDITEQQRKAALRYLEQAGFIQRIRIKGFVPWFPKTSGTYVFYVPVPERIATITSVPGQHPRLMYRRP